MPRHRAPPDCTGFTLWITGLSGAGKSTLASSMRDVLTARGRRVEVLDGDEVRTTLSAGLGYSQADRDANVRRLGYVGRLLSRNGVVTIVAAISPCKALRAEVRAAHDAPFVEVFADCTLEELVRRDVKGLYARALRGELAGFTGISDPYEPPDDPEIHLHTDRESVAASVGAIVTWLERARLIDAAAGA